MSYHNRKLEQAETKQERFNMGCRQSSRDFHEDPALLRAVTVFHNKSLGDYRPEFGPEANEMRLCA